ncbi:AbrB/MazE/SpoVT family DNA-binding domain-containing protein [Paenibacillus sp. 481]|uniref:AbrB/MazE/SpoVT family DNA-binding domain-containing protein n=1 Tax=Paenibacillus sp. 481 TaxID=2835869 RepID=UPI001E42EB3A|nr:AbrB/MazE/SpoVT family DNA-binding domain-containing protein [Paenibacillus sp. 481]UHA74437.1 AbrB/MazE/SpoVT family DNA-binding domain-containing protein [Paenibacillus sp. 481]
MSIAVGIVRNIDELGRIVIPAEMRQMLHMGKGDPVVITSDNVSVTLRKYAPGCTFCDSLDRLLDFKGKKICSHCKVRILNGGE